MTDPIPPDTARPPSAVPSARDARRKAALKANMARRKTQARARATLDGSDTKEGGQDAQALDPADDPAEAQQDDPAPPAGPANPQT